MIQRDVERVVVVYKFKPGNCKKSGQRGFSGAAGTRVVLGISGTMRAADVYGLDIKYWTIVDGVGGTVAVAAGWCSVLDGYKFQTLDRTPKFRSEVVIASALERWGDKFNAASDGIGQRRTCNVP